MRDDLKQETSDNAGSKMSENAEGKEVIEEYDIQADNVPAHVTIFRIQTEDVPIYDIEFPVLGEGTEAILEQMIEELAEKVPVSIEGNVDPNKIQETRKQFYSDVYDYLKQRLAKLEDAKAEVLAGMILHRMFGLGFIDLMMSDDLLEELTINGARQPVAVYHKKHGWCKSTKMMNSEDEIFNFSSQIGRKVGREINSLHPIMDAHLLTGDRVASTLFPISTGGNTITIRRFSRSPWTPAALLKSKTMDAKIMAFLWLAIQYEMNILVAGGTASGKTSALNALCGFMPSNQRILSIEDTRELSLPKQLEWNWVPMNSRNKNPEGQGEVTMLDLMVASLRMRPDRIVVGEVRKREQAETLFEAMHTGHSVYATMHADTSEQIKRRLIEPPIQIPKTEAESLHLVLVQHRDRRTGLRRTLEVAEVLTGSKDELQLNYLFRYRPRSDTFEKVDESTRIKHELNLHTGMTDEDIRQDLEEKEMILNWLVEADVTDIDHVGKVMHIYYSDKAKVVEAARSGANVDEI